MAEQRFKIGYCSVDLIGFEEMKLIMDKYGAELGPKLYLRVLMRSAMYVTNHLRKGNYTPIADKDMKMRNRAYPRGTLRRSIGTTKLKSKGGDIGLKVGYRSGGNNATKDGWFGIFLERGTKERKQKGAVIAGKYRRFKTEKSTGKIEGRWLMKNAWLAQRETVRKTMEEGVQGLIEKIWNGKDWI